MSRPRTPRWAVWAAGGAVLLVVGGRGLRTLVRNGWDLLQARRELARLQQEQASLQEQLKSLRKDDASLEGLARKELGLMKPGEVEYRFQDSKR